MTVKEFNTIFSILLLIFVQGCWASDDTARIDDLVNNSITASDYGPSFSCNHAKLSAELAICSNKELSKLDKELYEAYSETLGVSDNREGLKKDQLSWLKNRNKCQNDRCIKYLYQKRIRYLLSYKAELVDSELTPVKPVWSEVCSYIHDSFIKNTLKASLIKPQFVKDNMMKFDLSKYQNLTKSNSVIYEVTQGAHFSVYIALNKVKLNERGLISDETKLSRSTIEGVKSVYLLEHNGTPYILTDMSYQYINKMSRVYLINQTSFVLVCR